MNRFRIDAAGRLSFEDAYQLRSNDYYSSRNYASRLIGDRLVFYTPLDLDGGDDFLPGMRRWRGDKDARFRPIAGGRQVHIPPVLRDGRGAEISTLHTVTTCDLAAAELECRARAVLGAESRSFYVSGSAMYLWISDAWTRRPRRRGASGFLYRMPLDGSAPSAVAVRGGPVDQFSFREDARAGRLHVLVRSEGGDDRMWRPEVSEGDPALVTVDLRLLGNGGREVPLNRYRPLPLHNRTGWQFTNRFVGNRLLYAAGGDREGERGNPVYVAPLGSGAIETLILGQEIDRIEVLGQDAMVVGGTPGGGLGFATVELGASPRVGDVHRLGGAQESESRSHAFFFRPDDRAPDGASGTLGLPVRREGGEHGAAAMLFLRRDARRLRPAGEVAAATLRNEDDGCVASCVDWYGNARPIFIGDRVFALMGYELVEGRLDGGRVREIARTDFSPKRR